MKKGKLMVEFELTREKYIIDVSYNVKGNMIPHIVSFEKTKEEPNTKLIDVCPVHLRNSTAWKFTFVVIFSITGAFKSRTKLNKNASSLACNRLKSFSENFKEVLSQTTVHFNPRAIDGEILEPLYLCFNSKKIDDFSHQAVDILFDKFSKNLNSENFFNNFLHKRIDFFADFQVKDKFTQLALENHHSQDEHCDLLSSAFERYACGKDFSCE